LSSLWFRGVIKTHGVSTTAEALQGSNQQSDTILDPPFLNVKFKSNTKFVCLKKPRYLISGVVDALEHCIANPICYVSKL